MKNSLRESIKAFLSSNTSGGMEKKDMRIKQARFTIFYDSKVPSDGIQSFDSPYLKDGKHLDTLKNAFELALKTNNFLGPGSGANSPFKSDNLITSDNLISLIKDQHAKWNFFLNSGRFDRENIINLARKLFWPVIRKFDDLEKIKDSFFNTPLSWDDEIITDLSNLEITEKINLVVHIVDLIAIDTGENDTFILRILAVQILELIFIDLQINQNIIERPTNFFLFFPMFCLSKLLPQVRENKSIDEVDTIFEIQLEMLISASICYFSKV